MRRHRLVVGGVVLAMAIGSCLSFGDLTGNSGTDASTTDANFTDAGSSDAESASDNFVIDSSPSGFCASARDAAFCEDFDESNDPFSFPAWDTVDIGDGGILMRASSDASAPNALLTGATAFDGSADIAANINKGLGSVGHANFSYDFILDQIDDTGGAELNFGQIVERANGAVVSLKITYLPASGALVLASVTTADASTSSVTLSPSFPISGSTWHHVSFDVNFTTVPATAKMLVDGTQVTNDAGITGAIYGAGLLTIQGGMYYTRAPTPGWQFRMDNVVLYLE